VAVILDGIGVAPAYEGNAVHLARTPTLDRLWQRYPTLSIAAHGTAVGLPSDADMGNSEVGHNALGAGRVFDQGAKLVGRAIADESLFEGDVWRRLVKQCSTSGATLHFIGLLSDGNVHSHIDQLLALLRRAATEGLARVRIHALLDGRDVAAQSALTYVDRLEAALMEINSAAGRDYRIASGGGRMLVTMDRYEADWAIVERGWQAHVLGRGRLFSSARRALESFRGEDPSVSDQFLPAFVVAEGERAIGPIVDGDGVVFFNFRGDRAIEISKAFEYDGFNHFPRERRPHVLYAGMMRYDGDLRLPTNYLVDPPAIERTMGEYLARNGIRQWAGAETQKFGHVTYFWNGNRSGMFDEKLETYVEVPSDRVPFEQRPWMKAAEVTDAALEALQRDRPGLLRLNYANGDMVGHTGDLQATIVAVEAVDLSLARLLQAVERVGGIALVTADHGNADEMIDWDSKTGAIKREADGRPKQKTSHSLSPVPLTIFDPLYRGEYQLDATLPHAGLSNVAATLFWLAGYQPPEHCDAPLIVSR
jgi:2,3-bisphosphoglycerate-independent phosphoglycerate mutase